MSVSLDRFNEIICHRNSCIEKPVYVALHLVEPSKADAKFAQRIGATLEMCGWLVRGGIEYTASNHFIDGVHNDASKALFIQEQHFGSRKTPSNRFRHCYERMSAWQEMLTRAEDFCYPQGSPTYYQKQQWAIPLMQCLGAHGNRPAKMLLTFRRQDAKVTAEEPLHVARSLGIQIYNLANNDTHSMFNNLCRQHLGKSTPF